MANLSENCLGFNELLEVCPEQAVKNQAIKMVIKEYTFFIVMNFD
jgi:hypothetical protein